MSKPFFQIRFYYYFILLSFLYGCSKAPVPDNSTPPAPSSFSYDVVVAYHQSGTNACFVDDYTDSGFMRVDVANDIVTITNIVNQGPNTFPRSGPDASATSVCTWIPDSLGMINITGASGTVSTFGGVTSGTKKYVLITCDSSARTAFPLWSISSQGNTDYLGGYTLPANPMILSIKLNDELQDTSFSSPVVGSGLEADMRIIATPRK